MQTLTAQGFFYVCAGVGCVLLSGAFALALLVSAGRQDHRHLRGESRIMTAEEWATLDIERHKRHDRE